jgi:serine protease Do
MIGLRDTALAAAFVLAVGFAPTASAQGRDSVVRLLEATRGTRIGVSVHDADDSDAKDTKQAKTGVVVDTVAPDGPADKAGVKSGDVIVEFDGERVRSVRQFSRLVQETPAGHAVGMAVTRGGQRVTVTVTTARSSFDDEGTMRLFDAPFGSRLTPAIPPEPPAPPAAPRAPRAAPAPPAVPFDTYRFNSGRRLGVTVETLDDQLAQYFGVKDGVLVRSVVADSAAQKAGVKAGDVITGVNGRQVYEVSDVNRAIGRMDSDTDEFTLEIVRDHKTQTLKGKLDARRRGTSWY